MIDIYTEKKDSKDWILQNDLYFNLNTSNEEMSQYITNITGNEKIDAEKLISQLFQGSLILKIKGTDNVITERM